MTGGGSNGLASEAASPVEPAADLVRTTFRGDVSALAIERHVETRGDLAVVDLQALPFPVSRVIVITDVPPGDRRGGHRHARGVQALFCLRGRIEVEIKKGTRSLLVLLRADGVGLRIDAGIWSQQHYVEAGSELLVLNSEPYDPMSYDDAP